MRTSRLGRDHAPFIWVLTIALMLLTACDATHRNVTLALKCGDVTSARFHIDGVVQMETGSVLRSACSVAASQGAVVATCPCNLTSAGVHQ